MSTPIVRQGALPHVAWVDLFNNGVAYEVIVMKNDRATGDLYFVRVDYLDEVDRKRITNILQRRDASSYQLWDLMSNITLGNGENALEFFHQLVQVRTNSGEIMTPRLGKSGIAVQQPKAEGSQPRQPQQPQPQAQQGPTENPEANAQAQAEAVVNEEQQPARKGPGRPRKNQ